MRILQVGTNNRSRKTVRSRLAVFGFSVMVVAVVAVAGMGGGSAFAADPQHGISLTKGCVSPTQVGQPYTCTYSVRNTLDDAQDTLTINGLTDVVHAQGGDVSSGNVFSSLRLVIGPYLTGFSTPPSCTGPGLTGNGTDASPWTGATSCTLPFGSRINVQQFSFYTVKPTDFNLPGHVLADSVNLNWQDVCNGTAAPGNPTPGGGNCNPNPPPVGAASQTIVEQLPSTTQTTIHNAAHSAVLAIAAGSTVHDLVTVSGGAGNPVPTGTVKIDWFTNNTCTGNPVTTSPSLALVNGEVDATAFPQGPLAAGLYGFRAHYEGDAANPAYLPSDGPCEPLRVVDANIQITPPTATNRVGQTHTFTAHVNVNDGTGMANAPAGTVITFTKDSGPGTLAATQCATVGATGSCTVDLNSTQTGVTTVSAHTDVNVSGVSLTRDTNGTAGNSGPAQKTWVDAKISIAANATNAVGQPHTFTVTLQKDTGNGSGFVVAANEHVDFTLTDANGAVHTAPTGTCTQGGGNTNASGQCTITFNSNTAGTVTAHATSTLSIGSPATSVTVATDGTGQNSGDAVKTYVDANIQITPATANNPVGANHVFTAHVNINTGNGEFVNAPAGTSISFAIVSGPGSFTTANPCTTVGATGSCTITLVSNTPGTTVVRATTTVSVGGVALTRTTDGTGANSGTASKNWADAAVRTDVHNAGHDVVLSVSSGTSVHDKVFVTKLAGTPASIPAPTGNVTFHRYSTIDCTGASVDVTVALGADGTAETSSFTATANMSYKADYAGNANYPARSGACEPLQVSSGGGSPGTPAIAITKNPKEQTVAKGGTATWTIVVTNTGQVTLTNVRVTDPQAPDCNRTSAQIPALASMAPGASLQYTCSLANVTASFTNVATDTGTPPTGPDVSASDSAHVTVPTPQPQLAPHITVTKNPKRQTFLAPGGSNVTWTIKVTNDGETVLTDVTLVDAKAPECNRTKADIPALASMAVGASVTYKCTKFVTPDFKSPNVVVASGQPPTGSRVTDNDSAAVSGAFAPPSKITIAKCPTAGPVRCIKSVNNVPNDTQSVKKNGTADFRVTVRNTGRSTLRNVTVTDPWAPACARKLGTMAPGSSKTYTCKRPGVTDGHTNTAAVVGTGPRGVKVKDSDVSRVILAIQPPPKISIAKCPESPDIPCVKRPVGDRLDQQKLSVHEDSSGQIDQPGTANFRVTVKNTGTVTLNDVTVTDALTPDCNRSLGTMAPGSSKTYTCTRTEVKKPFLNVSKVVGTADSGAKVRDQDVSSVITAPFTG
jgi:uncharacterized repeat protein (TIGR01451 family)